MSDRDVQPYGQREVPIEERQQIRLEAADRVGRALQGPINALCGIPPWGKERDDYFLSMAQALAFLSNKPRTTPLEPEFTKFLSPEPIRTHFPNADEEGLEDEEGGNDG